MRLPPLIALALAGGWFLATSPARGEGAMVTLREKREETLAMIELVLHRADPDFDLRLAEERNPFQPLGLPATSDLGGAETTGTVESGEPVVQAPEPVRAPPASEMETLRNVAAKLNPTGAMISGQRRLLILGQGSNLLMGTTFEARVGGLSHSVTLVEVTERSFTLQLNQTRFTKDFSNTRAGATIDPAP